MTNLLRNPSFEGGWYHPSNIPELQIPKEWEFWYADANTPNPYDPAEHSRFVRPEVNHKSRAQLPPEEHDKFILDGEWTLKVFKGNGSFFCSLGQSLALKPNTTYQLNIRGHADVVDHWEDSTKIPAADPNSCLMRASYEYDTGRSFSEWVSLAGTEKSLAPFAYSHTFKTTGDEFHYLGVEFMCPFPVANNGLFLDKWELVEKVVEPEPEPEPEPPTGCLRGPIDIVSFLVSPNESLPAVLKTIEPAWRIFRWSLFGSADHAALSCGAKSINVIASNWLDWGLEYTLEDFMAEHYPDVELIPFGYDSSYQLLGAALAAGLKATGVKLSSPSSYHPPYITAEFGQPRSYGNHEGLDLRGSYKTWGTRMLAAIDGEVVFAGWNESEPWYGYQVRTRTELWGGYKLLTRYAHMVKGSIKVSNGQLVKSGDILGYVGSTGRNLDGTPSCTGDHVHIDCRVVSPTIPSNVKLYCDPELLIDFSSETQEQPAPPLPNVFLSLHRQTDVDGILEFVELVKPRWLKLVTDGEYARRIKEVSPNTKVIYRDAPNIPDQNGLLQLAEINADYIDAIEEQNETIATNDPAGTKVAVDRAVKFSNDLAARQLPVKACLLNVAVGNPGHNEIDQLLPAAEAAVRNGHYLGYHPYFPCHPNYAEQWMKEEAKHHHMRSLLSWDPYFVSRGLEPKYLLTECGAIGAFVREDGRPGGYVGAGSGWRAPETLAGDRARYFKLLLDWQRMVEEWNRWHDNRAPGGVIFTVGAAYVGWDKFKLWQEDLSILADLLKNT
jgi:hypothetical protein